MDIFWNSPFCIKEGEFCLTFINVLVKTEKMGEFGNIISFTYKQAYVFFSDEN